MAIVYHRDVANDRDSDSPRRLPCGLQIEHSRALRSHIHRVSVSVEW